MAFTEIQTKVLHTATLIITALALAATQTQACSPLVTKSLTLKATGTKAATIFIKTNPDYPLLTGSEVYLRCGTTKKYGRKTLPAPLNEKGEAVIQITKLKPKTKYYVAFRAKLIRLQYIATTITDPDAIERSSPCPPFSLDYEKPIQNTQVTEFTTYAGNPYSYNTLIFSTKL